MTAMSLSSRVYMELPPYRSRGVPMTAISLSSRIYLELPPYRSRGVPPQTTRFRRGIRTYSHAELSYQLRTEARGSWSGSAERRFRGRGKSCDPQTAEPGGTGGEETQTQTPQDKEGRTARCTQGETRSSTGSRADYTKARGGR